MKKITTALFYVLLTTFATTTLVKAQKIDRGVAFASIKNKAALETYLVNSNSGAESNKSTKDNLTTSASDIKTAKDNLKAMKASFRATENFKKTFKDVPDASWTVEDHVIVASFKKADIKTDVVYDRRGYLVHSLTSFPADKTPANIRSIVESDYPNGDITFSVQVKEGDMDFFIVQLEDKRTIKQVSVYNGEPNLIKDLRKSL